MALIGVGNMAGINRRKSTGPDEHSPTKTKVSEDHAVCSLIGDFRQAPPHNQTMVRHDSAPVTFCSMSPRSEMSAFFINPGNDGGIKMTTVDRMVHQDLIPNYDMPRSSLLPLSPFGLAACNRRSALSARVTALEL